ncbi:hypothetical protein RhiirA1_478908 [Rhizophagus irregularis]|uniref:Uncharacterized protein n=1 Tax=Rhizophagus irregularis TaxID=588596 RepID=A0A2N0QRD8_9GLOM|nr:hypothetical protein RhiirA1_478908 [Rhizophagus irregularis]
MVKGGKLKGYCQTRWMTACDCVSSVLRCEEALKNIANNNLNYLKQNIKEIIMRRFFMDIEELQLILKPIKEAIKYLEMKNATLADCFLQLIKLSYSIKSLSETHTTFRQQCIKAFNKRWMQFNFRLYMLAYLLHPLYRGKGFRNQICRKVVYWAIENIWIKMGGGENFSSKLIGQIAAFCDNLPPYNNEFIPKYYTVEFYQLVRNGIYQNINDEIREEELDNEDEDYGDTEEELVNIEKYEKFGHKSNDSVLQSENYFNFVSKELVELLKLQEPRVVIEPVNVDYIVDHGNENFDIEKLLDQQFSEDNDVNV